MRALLAAGLVLLGAGCGEPPRTRGELEAGFTVAAASSLAGVVEDLVEGWVAAGEPAPRLTIGPSSTLARQLEGGAPFDLLLSADERWLDELAANGRLDGDARVDLARGRLVVAHRSGEPGGSSAATAPLADRAAFPAGRWTTGDPDFVPLGQYAREALASGGSWQGLSGRLIPAGSARAALRLLELGEVDWAILYRSDAVGSGSVEVVRDLDAALHRPILYCAAPTPSAGPEAMRFLRRIAGAKAAASFAARGFLPAEPAGDSR
jgi:molybdate transport system substrate-binding protein